MKKDVIQTRNRKSANGKGRKGERSPGGLQHGQFSKMTTTSGSTSSSVDYSFTGIPQYQPAPQATQFQHTTYPTTLQQMVMAMQPMKTHSPPTGLALNHSQGPMFPVLASQTATA